MSNSCKVRYGEPVTAKAEYVALKWRARRVESDERGEVDVAALFDGIEGKGVYCFEGRHDAHPNGAVLYVGQAADDGGSSLRDRMRKSFSKFHDRGVVYSDTHDLTVRWAEVIPQAEAYIDDIESVLIVGHAPPFNAQEVRRWYTGPRPGLVVLNAGAKGRLHPVVAAIYHSKEPWP